MQHRKHGQTRLLYPVKVYNSLSLCPSSNPPPVRPSSSHFLKTYISRNDPPSMCGFSVSPDGGLQIKMGRPTIARGRPGVMAWAARWREGRSLAARASPPRWEGTPKPDSRHPMYLSCSGVFGVYIGCLEVFRGV